MPYELKPFDLDCETTEYLETHQHQAGGADRWLLNFGPQHPATHTTLRLVMELDGERVARVTPHIGYLHSGFEKLAEALDFNQYVTICSRMNYVSPISNDIAWHHAVEKLFDIDLTPRCKVVRTIMAELARIQDHLMCVGAAALDLGAFTGFLYGFNERERIYDIVDYISGQRFHPDWTRVGGAMADLPDEKVFVSMVKRFIHEQLPPALADLEGLLNTNRIFRDRTEGVGAISKEDAIAWSLSGPLARASGVKRDLRKDEPYLCYADNWDGQGASPVQFSVPIATTGCVLGRFLVRVQEIKESVRIIEQLIDSIPAGPDECGCGRQDGQALQEFGLWQHRRADSAFRAGDDQPQMESANQRNLWRAGNGQWRAGFLHRQRWRPVRLACQGAPAEFYPLQLHGQNARRAHARRYGGCAGQPEYHRSRVGSLTCNLQFQV